MVALASIELCVFFCFFFLVWNFTTTVNYLFKISRLMSSTYIDVIYYKYTRDYTATATYNLLELLLISWSISEQSVYLRHIALMQCIYGMRWRKVGSTKNVLCLESICWMTAPFNLVYSLQPLWLFTAGYDHTSSARKCLVHRKNELCNYLKKNFLSINQLLPYRRSINPFVECIFFYIPPIYN
jgi:hypothetical protein